MTSQGCNVNMDPLLRDASVATYCSHSNCQTKKAQHCYLLSLPPRVGIGYCYYMMYGSVYKFKWLAM